MNINRYDLHFNNKIERWDEAVPLGNGKLGLLMAILTIVLIKKGKSLRNKKSASA